MFRTDKGHILADWSYSIESRHCRVLELRVLSKDTYSRADNLHFTLSSNKIQASMPESRTS